MFLINSIEELKTKTNKNYSYHIAPFNSVRYTLNSFNSICKEYLGKYDIEPISFKNIKETLSNMNILLQKEKIFNCYPVIKFETRQKYKTQDPYFQDFDFNLNEDWNDELNLIIDSNALCYIIFFDFKINPFYNCIEGSKLKNLQYFYTDNDIYFKLLKNNISTKSYFLLDISNNQIIKTSLNLNDFKEYKNNSNYKILSKELAFSL